MYASRTTQLIVGIFTLVGIGALAVLSLRLGRIELIPEPGYTVYANFDNISGLKLGDRVEIAGVQVGKVRAISLKGERARVALRLRKKVEVDDEAIAAIKTSGIIGEKFVSIAPGAGDPLHDGGTIRQTESAFVLEDAIGQLINSSGTGGKKSEESGKEGGAKEAPSAGEAAKVGGSSCCPGGVSGKDRQSEKPSAGQSKK
jgi:phospholipid/cholesterol/gamma-HCH transport system substrate-binding protein